MAQKNTVQFLEERQYPDLPNITTSVIVKRKRKDLVKMSEISEWLDSNIRSVKIGGKVFRRGQLSQIFGFNN